MGYSKGLNKISDIKNRMLFMKHGFADKTEDELQQALQEIQLQEKKLLFSRRIKLQSHLASYNNCKICFFPQIRGQNQIAFCNACRASYHFHCYGISLIDNTSLYICDSCLFMQKNDWEYDESYRRPLCQICYSQKDLPLKQIDNHYYHVTCLFFFKYCDTKSFKIILKYKQLVNEINCQATKNEGKKCAYCLQQNQYYGIRFRCSAMTCEVEMHPLCAYLSGCAFDIRRSEDLQISIRCQYHTYGNQEDDEIRQVFIRRYFCNYKSIQILNEDQFKPIYRQQKKKIKQQIEKLNNQQQNQYFQQYFSIQCPKQQTQKQYNQQQTLQFEKFVNIQPLDKYLNSKTNFNVERSRCPQIIILSDDD